MKSSCIMRPHLVSTMLHLYPKKMRSNMMRLLSINKRLNRQFAGPYMAHHVIESPLVCMLINLGMQPLPKQVPENSPQCPTNHHHLPKRDHRLNTPCQVK